jgi:hypothetical protein
MAAVKPFENRKWATEYRGPLVIHAGKSKEMLDGLDVLRRLGIDVEMPQLEFGVALGTVELIRVVRVGELAPRDAEHWSAEGPFCWEVRSPRLFRRPFAWLGALGLFEIGDSIVEAAF